MTVELVFLFISVAAFGGSIVAVRWMESERLRQQMTCYALTFPRDLDEGAVLAFLTGLAGIGAPHRLRIFSPRAVLIEISAAAEQIAHHLIVPRALTGIVLSQLRAAMPEVVVREDAAYRPTAPTIAAELGLSSHHRSLRVDHPETVAVSLLASLQPLGPREAMIVQFVVSPVGPVAPVRRPATQRKNGPELLIEGLTTQLHDAEAVRAARTKQETPLFMTTVRLGVTAEPSEGRLLMRRLLAPFHMVTTPGAHLFRRQIPMRWTAAGLVRRSLPILFWPLTLNTRELTALGGFPIGSTRVRGLALSAGRLYPPTAIIPSSGRVIGDAAYPGRERPIAITVLDALLHTWAVGPTGVGKSTLLANLITQDLQAGLAVVVIDPKGDLASDILDRIPPKRTADVILLDVADDRPVGFNILAGSDRNPELAADQVLAIFHRLYRAYWGPRTADVLLASLSTVAREPGATLLDVPLILTNDAARRRLVGRIDEPFLAGFWAAYEAISPGERAQAIGPVMNKLRQFLMRPSLRAVLGQPEPTFTLEEVINRGKVLLVSLPPGLIGEEASALIGSLVVARLWQAIQGRIGVPAERRRPVMVYLDEFQTFIHLPIALDDLLAKARGLGAGFVLANQSPLQLPAEIKNAVFANCRSKITFQASATDAAVLAKEIGGGVRAEDISSLPAYDAIASVAAGGQVAPPVSLRTRAMPPALGTAEGARAASRTRYGRDRAEVEAEIRARQEGPRPEGPTLRRTRGVS